MKLTFAQILILFWSIVAVILYALSWWFNKPLDVAGMLAVLPLAVLSAVHLFAEYKNGNGK